MDFAFPWLIFTGIIGALLTILYHWWQNRIQKINYYKSFDTIFHPAQIESDGEYKLLISEQKNTTFKRSVSNYHRVGIVVENTSSKDFDKFNFGLKFLDNFEVLNYSFDSDGHQRMITTGSELSINQVQKDIIFTLIPFNRKDKYEISVYVTNSNNSVKFSESNISIDSIEPVTLIDYNSSKQREKRSRRSKFIVVAFLALLFLISYPWYKEQSRKADEAIESLHERLNSGGMAKEELRIIDSLVQVNTENLKDHRWGRDFIRRLKKIKTSDNNRE